MMNKTVVNIGIIADNTLYTLKKSEYVYCAEELHLFVLKGQFAVSKTSKVYFKRLKKYTVYVQVPGGSQVFLPITQVTLTPEEVVSRVIAHKDVREKVAEERKTWEEKLTSLHTIENVKLNSFIDTAKLSIKVIALEYKVTSPEYAGKHILRHVVIDQCDIIDRGGFRWASSSVYTSYRYCGNGEEGVRDLYIHIDNFNDELKDVWLVVTNVLLNVTTIDDVINRVLDKNTVEEIKTRIGEKS